jgi:hypothetical protein
VTEGHSHYKSMYFSFVLTLYFNTSIVTEAYLFSQPLSQTPNYWNIIQTKAHFKCKKKIDANKQHIFAETCLYQTVESFSVVPHLSLMSSKGEVKLKSPYFLQLWWALVCILALSWPCITMYSSSIVT